MLSLQPIGQRANLARRAGVALGSAGVTLYFCLLIIGRAAVGRLRREHVDLYTRAWSRHCCAWCACVLRCRDSARISMMAGAT